MASQGGLKGWTLITGASEGLGREFAILAAAEGRDLILAVRQAQKMEKLAEDLRARHKIAVEIIATDLSDPEAVELLWRRAATRRRIDVLVNTADLPSEGRFQDSDFAHEDRSVRVNVLALTILMKRAVAHMLAAGGGRILNLCSVAGHAPGPGKAVHHATQAYVLSLSEAVAEDLRGTSVTVTAFCPGATATGAATAAGRIARSGWQAMLAGRRIRVTGIGNRLFALASKAAPRFLMPRITALFLK
ncbi:MAG: SDR family NAD(P)-dependent oxidoreductase [Paracoccaceae bacterium]